jgi:DNA-binding CsgD family transcriptional regulator
LTAILQASVFDRRWGYSMDASGHDPRTEVPERIDRASVANEVGAAIAHQLNGPLTALLLYLEDLCQNCDRFPAADCDGSSLKQIAENALHEAERVCALMQRIGDTFEAPLQEDTAIAQGRDVIRWWSQAGNAGNQAANAPELPARKVSLTAREREVLRFVREGCSNKEGGARLQISHRTFESHRARLMRKFGAKNAAGLLRLAALDQQDESPSAFQGVAAHSKRSGRTIPCKC